MKKAARVDGIPSDIFAKVDHIDTYEVVQWLTGPVETPNNSMDDLPALLQDKIYAALEIAAKKHEKPLVIVYVACDRDPDPKDRFHEWYMHIVASEIVTADSRKISIVGGNLTRH